MVDVDVGCSTVDLTNSDDESALEPRRGIRRGQGGACLGTQREGKEQNPNDVVDLTLDTPSPPDRHAGRSAGGSVFGEEEAAMIGGAGGRARSICSKRIRGQESSSGSSSRSTAGGGLSASKARIDNIDPDQSVSCPICSKDMTARSRLFLSCEHWACSECLSQVSRRQLLSFLCLSSALLTLSSMLCM